MQEFGFARPAVVITEYDTLGLLRANLLIKSLVTEIRTENYEMMATNEAIDLAIQCLDDNEEKAMELQTLEKLKDTFEWAQRLIDVILLFLRPHPKIKPYFQKYYCENCFSDITKRVFLREDRECESCLGDYFCSRCQHEHDCSNF